MQVRAIIAQGNAEATAQALSAEALSTGASGNVTVKPKVAASAISSIGHAVSSNNVITQNGPASARPFADVAHWATSKLLITT